MKKLILLLTILALLIPVSAGLAAPAQLVIPTFTIKSVDEDDEVTIEAKNFPKNDSFNVLMGAFGTRGIGGVKVDTQNTGSNSSFTATYQIPNSLKGSSRIAIRLESPSSGYFSYNWFYNNSTNGSSSSSSSSSSDDVVLPPAGTIPSTTIKEVDRNKTVEVKVEDFPSNVSVTVRMDVRGQRAEGGTVVKTVNSGDTGDFTKTFDIPSSLKGVDQIAVRFESPSTGYFAFDWFYNTDGNVPTSGSSGSSGSSLIPIAPGTVPTFSITNVDKNKTVTIKTSNFPGNDSFTVRMDVRGNRAIGGVKVDTIDSGSGGSFTATFDIPSSLKDVAQIAIRLESSSSGYFSYNWFYNVDAP